MLYKDQRSLLLSVLPAVYLGVTNLSAYQVRMTGLCTQWQPQRHAAAYRVVVESLLSEYTNTLLYRSHMTSVLQRVLHHVFISIVLSTCLPVCSKTKRVEINFQYFKASD